MNISLAQLGPSTIAQIINLVFVLVIVALPFIILLMLLKWNRERKEKLDRIEAKLDALIVEKEK